jgi:hypothetical protein
MNSALWEQAFSGDGGNTWETNWHTQYFRTGDTARATREGAPAPIRRSPVDGAEPPVAYCCPAFALRRYSVPKDREGTLIELFDQENDFARQVEGGPRPGSE